MINIPINYYTSFFCEENCWQLLNSQSLGKVDNFEALLLTNPQNTIALTQQKAAPPQEVIIWDYHVILHDHKNSLIYDMDTRLTFPEPTNSYFAKTFGDQTAIPEEYQTCIRQVPGTVYLTHFDSDRSHMLAADGTPLQKFPHWPLIRSQAPTSLVSLLNDDSDEKDNLLTPFISISQFLNGQL